MRFSDTITTLFSVASVTVVVCVSIHHGYDHTLVKLGIAAIAGLAGFSARGILSHK